MGEQFEENFHRTVEEIAENYQAEEIFFTKPGAKFPKRNVIIEIIKEVRRILFPGYFGDEFFDGANSEYFVGNRLMYLKRTLCEQIYAALAYYGNGESEEQICRRSEQICTQFIQALPVVQRMLFKDVQAAFDGDPAAKSKEEIILSYPGLFAIFVYRIAHLLYVQKVHIIPRIMTEYAHSRTGIDINAGAQIGEYFFMDHGTGIVIGETTVIGDHVKLYQGVTLGALSTRMGQQLSGKKRHPTIKDNVTIYSNASVLGGNTVIGENTVIGGSAFITESVPADTKVSIKSPELSVKGPAKEDVWYWEI